MLRISKFFHRSKQKPYIIFLFNKAIKTFETHLRMFRKIKKSDLYYVKKYSPPDPFPKI
jgi:hypothetical protein